MNSQGAKHIAGRSIIQSSCYQFTSIVKAVIAIADIFSLLTDPSSARHLQAATKLGIDSKPLAVLVDGDVRHPLAGYRKLSD